MAIAQSLNVVYLHSHDTGRYVEPYGYPVSTPNIQRLATEGTVFRQAFAAAPTCSPSRAALLTGQSPHSAGMLGLAHRGFRLKDPRQHLASYLQINGYLTILAGTQHLTSDDPGTLGYGSILHSPVATVDYVATGATKCIELYAAGSRDQPLFLDVGFVEAHRPFPPVDEQASQYVRPPAIIPDAPETRRDMAGFLASVREVDRGVGLVLDSLDRAALSDNTLVIFTTDHGPPFPGMKSTLTDHGTGVVLILRGPGNIAKGGVSDALVSQIDVFPTVCDLIGIARPDWLQGQSMVPLLTGEDCDIRDALFSEVTFHAAYEPQRSIRTKRWTFIRRYGDRRLPVLPNTDASESLDLMVRNGWQRRPVEREQLFDNLLDPMQRENLAGDQQHSELLRELVSKLESWMRETNDPLLLGDVRPPPGAMVNDPDSLSPDEELYVADFEGMLTPVRSAWD